MKNKYIQKGRKKKRTKMIEERKKRKWTQKDLAEQISLKSNQKIKVTRQHIGAIERGINNPSIYVLKFLSVILELPAEDFY